PPSVAIASATPSRARSPTTSQARPATSRPAAARQLASVWRKGAGDRALSRSLRPHPFGGVAGRHRRSIYPEPPPLLAEGAENDQQSVAATEDGRSRIHADRAPRRHHHPRDPACDRDPLVPQLPHAGAQV